MVALTRVRQLSTFLPPPTPKVCRPKDTKKPYTKSCMLYPGKWEYPIGLGTGLAQLRTFQTTWL